MIRLNNYIITPTIFPDKTSQVWKLPETLSVAYNKIVWDFENESELIHIAQLADGKLMHDPYNSVILISTLEGVMSAVPGSYIVKGNEGEFWAVKQSIFEATYEEVND